MYVWNLWFCVYACVISRDWLWPHGLYVAHQGPLRQYVLFLFIFFLFCKTVYFKLVHYIYF